MVSVSKSSLFVALLLFLFPFMGVSQVSPLATGRIFQLQIDQHGIYEITPDFLSSIGAGSDLDPQHIHVYGLAGGMLPQANSIARPKGIQQLPLQVFGNGNEVFETGEKLIFYAEGPNKVMLDMDDEDLVIYEELNLYATRNYVYLIIDGNRPFKEITSATPPTNTDRFITNKYQAYHFHEEELEWKLGLNQSGRKLYGERLIADSEATNTLGFTIDMEGRIPNSPLKLRSSLLSSVFSSGIFIGTQINGVEVDQFVSDVIGKDIYDVKGIEYLRTQGISAFDLSGNTIELTYSIQQDNNGSNVTVDYFSLNYEKPLQYVSGEQLRFRDVQSIAFENANAEYQIGHANGADFYVWEVTDPILPTSQTLTRQGTQSSFLAEGGKWSEFIAFSENTALLPEFVETVPNQSILAYATPDLLIITTETLKPEAERLAQFRQVNDGLSAQVVSLKEVNHLFSSGKQDVTAIRDYVRHLYQKGSNLQYLLLFGESTYDYKDIEGWGGEIVPTYQSRNSVHPVFTYQSDDYYGFMDEDEGHWNEIAGQTGSDDLDLGVGRLPVGNLADAQIVVDKLIHYDTATVSLGNWRKEVLFLADDGDGSIHQDHVEQLSSIVIEEGTSYLPKKLFIDSYPKELEGSNFRSPAVREQLNREWEDGLFILNYSGHGSETALTSENVLNNGIINSLQNQEHLPLVVTATCEFGRNDDPERKSGAELALLNPNGGAIALLTTTRPVFANTNLTLNKAFYNSVFRQNPDGTPLRLGDIMRLTKNNSTVGVNNRNFMMLGDPSMTLAFPEYNARLTTLNGEPITENDRMEALKFVEFEGQIEPLGSEGTVVENFNGTLNVTVYDKPLTKYTRQNNEDSPQMAYEVLESIIFQGQANVENGKFQFSFIVPKDIDYSPGNGKILMYAQDPTQSMDASGDLSTIAINGTATNAPVDVAPPQLTAYMNDESFFDGQLLGDSPTLYATLFDESGINTTGLGIGHDLLATLTNGQGEEQEFKLNSSYQTEPNSFQKGNIVFPFFNLLPGEYELEVSAWDTYNNPVSTTLRFTVEGTGEAIDLIKLYPNPAVNVANLSFINRRPNEALQVSWKIYDQSGGLVEEVAREFDASPIAIELQWDRPAQKARQGLYVTHLICTYPEDGTTIHKYLKLVLID